MSNTSVTSDAQLLTCAWQTDRQTYKQHLVSGFNLLLSCEEDEDVAERLTDMNLKYWDDDRVDVVRLRSLCVVDVDRITTSRDPEDWRIVKELNTPAIVHGLQANNKNTTQQQQLEMTGKA